MIFRYGKNTEGFIVKFRVSHKRDSEGQLQSIGSGEAKELLWFMKHKLDLNFGKNSIDYDHDWNTDNVYLSLFLHSMEEVNKCLEFIKNTVSIYFGNESDEKKCGRFQVKMHHKSTVPYSEYYKKLENTSFFGRTQSPPKIILSLFTDLKQRFDVEQVATFYDGLTEQFPYLELSRSTLDKDKIKVTIPKDKRDEFIAAVQYPIQVGDLDMVQFRPKPRPPPKPTSKELVETMFGKIETLTIKSEFMDSLRKKYSQELIDTGLKLLGSIQVDFAKKFVEQELTPELEEYDKNIVEEPFNENDYEETDCNSGGGESLGVLFQQLQELKQKKAESDVHSLKLTQKLTMMMIEQLPVKVADVLEHELETTTDLELKPLLVDLLEQMKEDLQKLKEAKDMINGLFDKAVDERQEKTNGDACNVM